MKLFLIAILAFVYFNINIDAPVRKPLGWGQYVSVTRPGAPQKAGNTEIGKKKANDGHVNF